MTLAQNTPKQNSTVQNSENPPDKEAVKTWIKEQALALGFSDCGFLSVSHPVFAKEIKRLQAWLDKGYGDCLPFLKENHHLRANPALLVEGAKTIISVRMDYLCDKPAPRCVEDDARPNHAIIARYARGRDYHKTMRQKLKQLAKLIEAKLPEWQHLTDGAPFVFRPFSDSAPIFEKAAAHHAGLGWEGKHTLLIHRQAGSFFNLGELFVSLDLAAPNEDNPAKNLCGSCSACIDVCPTRAIVGARTLNAAACIAYLTIEHDGSIPTEYRKGIGNRIFGCDDCQLICPWNKFAKITQVADYAPRHSLDDISLLQVWAWSEDEFLQKSEGSPLRRTGYLNLLRNTAIALGNAPFSKDIITALQGRIGQNPMLDEHIDWALNEQRQKQLKIDCQMICDE
ncbi:tRNA epoxyqueuosine(34) reductase QueG [Moraxella caviae]|uniref:Epoxyqueuosine reductase n=1 Tax=Moraxella caviae TaxID=34060 RepID=A0A1S9ZXY6_9GAMM|nr:tRNA epoxyqueuosine(34) reductase QueG [Moraxella caviae]OOR88277.1 tRNA epoxyqueuosine(34) reductase QueG [Moraxella caviae]STZ13888.1 Epoxyqueuosine reductase [Moraxella caviae]